MKISELIIGDLYKVNFKSKNKAYVVKTNDSLELKFTETTSPAIEEKSFDYKNSLFVYLGSKTVKIKKHIDKNKVTVYNYKPHYMLCVSTGEILKIRGYYIQALFTKPKK